MDDVLRFLAQYELWIYGILGFAALLYLGRLLRYWREWRGAIFGLERENALRRFSAALSFFVFLLLFALGEFLLVSFISPTYPGVQQLPTATMQVLTTPTITLPAVTPATREPTAEAGPTLAPVVEGGCIPGQIEWTYPLNGDQISGLIEPKGTVQVANLGFYKYEFSPAESSAWVAVAAGNIPRSDEPLGGSWNTSNLTPGDYRLRLVVTDNQNSIFPACTITVRIVGE